MTRTQSKGQETTTTVDLKTALIDAHADAARDHLAHQLELRAELDRDIDFAVMVTNSGAGR